MKLDDLGLNAQALIAGFAGGVAHAFAFKQTEPAAQVGSVVMGTLTANYFGPLVSKLLHLGDWQGAEGAAAFLVGISAMAIIQGTVAAVQRSSSSWGENRIDGGRP